MTDDYTDLARCMGCEPHKVSGLIQQHAPWNGKSACDDAMREREAVVAWLRALSADRVAALLGQGFSRELGFLADAIDNGEHRNEGGE